jgi:hypothetical protein
MTERVLEKDPLEGYGHIYGSDRFNAVVFSETREEYSYPDVPNLLPIATVYDQFREGMSDKGLAREYQDISEEAAAEAREYIAENFKAVETVYDETIAELKKAAKKY